MMPEDPHDSSADVAFMAAPEMLDRLAGEEISSAELVTLLLARIEAIDAGGPRLRSVLQVNERVLDEAAELDSERRNGRLRGPLHGLPVLLKDNLDTTAPLLTTAGSLALGGSAGSDCPVVAQLRASGALLLGKANLSEWANFRGRPSSSGWSARGGQVLNPHALNRTPGGSSSGSAAGVAAGLAPLAVGTETDGSVLCPSAACGVVGLKPTVGLLSRTGIVPISSSQDTAGPMARSVAGVALLLEAMSGAAVDGDDDGTQSGPAVRRGTYAQAVTAGVRGMKVGFVRGEGVSGYHDASDRLAEAACEALRSAGARIVDPVPALERTWHDDEMIVLCTEFKAGLERYLRRRRRAMSVEGEDVASLPSSVEDVIAFNERSPGERLDLFGQDILERAAAACDLGDATYLAARDRNWSRTRVDGIDALCESHGVQVLVALTMQPAWQIDHVNGDTYAGSSWSVPAIAGYPSLTVPVGEVSGLPVGLTLYGPAWTEETLLAVAGSLERELGTGPQPSFTPAVAILA